MTDRIHLTADQQQLVYLFSQETDCDLEMSYILLEQNNWQFNDTLEIYHQLFPSPGQNPYTLSAAASSDTAAPATSTQGADEKNVSLDDSLCDSSDCFSVDLKVMSWNIDCLSEKMLKARMMGLFHEIKTIQPDVVFLQEVIEPVLHSLYDVFLSRYQVYKAESDFAYFVVMMVNKRSLSKITFNTIPYQNTQMGRNLIRCDADFLGMPVSFFTTHLESTKSVFKTRIEQLKQCVEEVANCGSSFKVFGGDLNLRDNEVVSVDLKDLKDAWVEKGGDKSKQYTWDMSKNDNLENMQNAKVKYRFDRVYYNSSATKTQSKEEASSASCNLVLKSFELVGTERLSCGVFASDHFGVLLQFELQID